MDLNTITIAQFKGRFNRDFVYATVPDSIKSAIPDPDYVEDQDIQNAFNDAQSVFNQGLFPNDTVLTLGYLYLSAHMLCCNINAANAGINNPASMPVNARSVGSVSESYTIPTEYTENPILAAYTQTSYGLKYLAIVLPAMVGNIMAVNGGTNP